MDIKVSQVARTDSKQHTSPPKPIQSSKAKARMPEHRRRFVERVPAPVYADNAQYRAARHGLHQTSNHSFPTQRAWDDQRAIDECRSRGDAARTSYFSERDSAKADVASLPSEEQRYYVPYVNITPRDHRRLIDPAREYLESELESVIFHFYFLRDLLTCIPSIAEKRENLYVRTPLAYDTLENQTRHYGHIQNHYGQADTADRFLVQHLRHAEYDASTLPLISTPSQRIGG
ncbi:MAG: hypothetical protein LQ345_005713 [Seirophora villosa]|nr:MAG: hypothetical protein LQ345_005713 [Seirophora villosa]